MAYDRRDKMWPWEALVSHHAWANSRAFEGNQKSFLKSKYVKLTQAGVCIWRPQFCHRRVLDSTLNATSLQTGLHSEHTVVQKFPIRPRSDLYRRLYCVFLRHRLLLRASQGVVGQVFERKMLWASKCLYRSYCSDPHDWYRHRSCPDAACMEPAHKHCDERGRRWSIFARKLVSATPPDKRPNRISNSLTFPI